MSEMTDRLSKYFEETPREQVEADWKATEDLQAIGPTVNDFLNTTLSKMMTLVEPSNYNIAIREDGKEFRIPKHLDYGDNIPKDKFCIQYGDRPCAFRNKYFDLNGRLKEQFWALDRIL